MSAVYSVPMGRAMRTMASVQAPPPPETAVSPIRQVCYSTVAVESRRTPRQGVTALHSGARSDGIFLKTIALTASKIPRTFSPPPHSPRARLKEADFFGCRLGVPEDDSNEADVWGAGNFRPEPNAGVFA